MIHKYMTRFDYPVPGEIRLTEKETDRSNDDYFETETYRVLFDDQGRATQIKEDGGDKDDIIYFAYNDEGRLARISWYESYTHNESYEAMTYQNGVFSKVNYNYDHEGDGIYEKGEIVFPADAFSDRPNDRLNIDPNWLLFMEPDEPEYMLPMLRLAGKGCDRLTLWLPSDYEEDDSMPGAPIGQEPNVTIHNSYDYCVHKKTERLQYTFNEDGTIATIVQPIVCIRMRHEYDIVVGNEPIDPDYPEAGYKGTIKNETRREIGRSTDRHKWTFTYRK